MEKRAEPRFRVASPVVLVPVDHPELEIECQIREVSAGGLRVYSNQELNTGDTVLLDTEHHMVIAVVRHVASAGTGWSIGVERVSETSKLDIPAGASRAEQIRMLTGEKSAPAEPQQAALFPLLPSAAAPEPQRLTSAEPTSPTLLPTVPQLAASPLAATPQATPPRATRLPEQAQAPKRLPVWVLVAVGFLLAGAALATFMQWQSRASGSQAPVVAPMVVESPAPPQPAPPSVTSNRFRVAARDAAWLAVSIDGKPVFAHMLAKGESHDFEFANYAHVRLGNASRLDVSASVGTVPSINDGNPLRLLELTPAGVAVLPWRNADPLPPSVVKKP